MTRLDLPIAHTARVRHVTTLELELRYTVAQPTHVLLRVAPMDRAAAAAAGPQIVEGVVDAAEPARPQQICREALSVTVDGAAVPVAALVEDALDNRGHRFDAPAGTLRITYAAEVRHGPAPGEARAQTPTREFAVRELPASVLPWLLPSTCCDAHVLMARANALFWHGPPGVARVQRVLDWIRQHVRYEVGASKPATTASDTFASRRGVCRDWAHLAIALLRAQNVPARLVTGYALFAEPPQDFHCIIEAWLGRWVAFDPTALCDPDHLVRVGIGRDANDLAFATIFGAMTMTRMALELATVDHTTGMRRDSAGHPPVLCDRRPPIVLAPQRV